MIDCRLVEMKMNGDEKDVNSKSVIRLENVFSQQGLILFYQSSWPPTNHSAVNSPTCTRCSVTTHIMDTGRYSHFQLILAAIVLP